MNIYEVIKKRRSVRSYKSDPVEDEKLARVLEAARLAPSAANCQPFQMIVIKSEKVKVQLRDAYSKKWFFEAPIIICACSLYNQAWKRNDGKNYADIDVAIAMEHLVLAATNEGLGTCWVAAFKVKVVKEIIHPLLNESNIEPVAMTPLGYPKDFPDATHRKPFGDLFKIIK